jgi:transposase
LSPGERVHSVLRYKRIDRGTFRVPETTEAGARHVEVDDASLEALLDGIDVEASSTPRRSRTRVH